MKKLIRKIKLINWRSHENTELEFDRGINVIMGRMGSGKSSITDAMCFAFYATFPNLQKKALKLDDVIMRSPKEKRVASVEIWFEIGGHEYYIKRVIERGKGTTTSELRRDGKLIEGPKSVAVTRLAEEILGMDYDLFTRAVYSEQNNIDYFLSLRPAERKKKIDELLMIDRFEKMRSAATTILNRVKERMNERLSDIQEMDENELRRKYDTVEKEMKEIEEFIKQREEKLREITNELGEKKKEVENLEAAARRIEELKKKISNLNGRYDSITKQLAVYGKYDEMKYKSLMDERDKLEKKKNSTMKEIDEIMKGLRNIEGEMGKLNSEILQIEKNAKEMKVFSEKIEDLKRKYKSIENLISEISGDEEKLKELQMKLGSRKAELSSLEESLEKLLSSGDKCPVCGASLDKDKKETLVKERKESISSTKKEIDNITNEMEKLKSRIETLKGERVVWEKLLARIDGIGDTNPRPYIEKLTTLKMKKEESERKLSTLDKETKDVESRLENVREEMKKLEMSRSLEEEIKRTEKEILSLEKELDSVEFDESLYKKLRSDVMELVGKRAEVETSILKDRQRLKDKEETLSEIEKQLKLLSEYKRDYEILKKMNEILSKFKLGLEKTQIQLRNNLIDLVNRNMSSIWKDFYPYEEIEDIRLNVLENDYRLELFNGTEWVPVDGIASGGERTTAAIALRIALSVSLVKQLKWIILDEPTHNLDETAIEMFSFILRERLSSMVNQIFIITHEEKLENAVTGNFYKLTKEHGVTKAAREDVS